MNYKLPVEHGVTWASPAFMYVEHTKGYLRMVTLGKFKELCEDSAWEVLKAALSAPEDPIYFYELLGIDLSKYRPDHEPRLEFCRSKFLDNLMLRKDDELLAYGIVTASYSDIAGVVRTILKEKVKEQMQLRATTS